MKAIAAIAKLAVALLLMSPVWLTRKELSARLKVPVATIAQWPLNNRGPKYARFGRHVRYKLDDVIAWENAQFDDEAS